jgi:hypothetical protein
LRSAVTIFIFLLSTVSLLGQKDSLKHKADTATGRYYVLQNVYRDGETLPEIEIKEVTIVGHGKGSSRFQYWRYERLVYNIKRVYPYSIIVREKLKLVNDSLESIKSDKDRRAYLKQVEKEVFRDYEDDMRNMTITQGRLLIKLISRETNNTSFDLIKEYRGKISAAFWQGIARIFGTSLKEGYDPYGEDALIERIIQEIEQGNI